MLPQLPEIDPHTETLPHYLRMLHTYDEPQDLHLTSMVKATGQLGVDEEGNWDYHGSSSGLSFLSRVQQQFGNAIAPPSGALSPFVNHRLTFQITNLPNPVHQPSTNTMPRPSAMLPPKEEARMLCNIALMDGGVLLRVVHIPTFNDSMDCIYETLPETYGNAENTFLPLLYAVLALGCLFTKKDAGPNETAYGVCIDEGQVSIVPL